MKSTMIAVLMIACMDSRGQTSLTNLSGRVYERAVVTERRPDGLMLRHKTGLELVRWNEWSEEIRTEHGYDPNVEAQAAADLIANRKARMLASSVSAKGFGARIVIIQMVDDGALANIRFSRSTNREVVEYKETRKTVGLGGSRIDNSVTIRTPVKHQVTDVEWVRIPGTVFVAKIGGRGVMVDGSVIDRIIYPAGTYEYIATDGSNRTVEKFTTDPMDLIDLDAFTTR